MQTLPVSSSSLFNRVGEGKRYKSSVHGTRVTASECVKVIALLALSKEDENNGLSSSFHDGRSVVNVVDPEPAPWCFPHLNGLVP